MRLSRSRGSLAPARAERDEQVVLAAEVEVHGAGGHAGRARHVGHLRVEEAALGEHLRGGTHDGVALVGDGRPRIGRLAGGQGRQGALHE
jgi:hypothetical protein